MVGAIIFYGGNFILWVVFKLVPLKLIALVKFNQSLADSNIQKNLILIIVLSNLVHECV